MKKTVVLKYLSRYNSAKTVRPPGEGVGTRRGVSASAAVEGGPTPPPPHTTSPEEVEIQVYCSRQLSPNMGRIWQYMCTVGTGTVCVDGHAGCLRWAI
jgi:hypothetical protein